MLQLIATWPINPSCDSFYKSDKILSNAPEIHYTFVYVMVHFFFQLKYYPVLQKCFFFVCLFVCFFPVRDSNLLGDRASETTGSSA